MCDCINSITDGMIHWEEDKDEDEDKESRRSWYYQARSTDIEQTSYVLLAMLEQGGKSAVSNAVPIVRWLSKQRNGLGGWSSTQVSLTRLYAYKFTLSFDGSNIRKGIIRS